ncbi:hypothetical protein K7A41_23505 [Sphingobacterium sp. InxBP1]|uniref:DUF6706 family protein n=1 Tax=Sphingobacterium sp. InxBP1 TaxID=2870328 RepID=UPI002244965F|nr:DUF6706 family protein [Sphingobacterium sp. InxBP1]MCW8314212.1 hypothetical protein [Sphingobacterium sp. InxBP1]
MASVKEVLVSSMGYKFPDATVDMVLVENGLDPVAERAPQNQDQTKALDLSRVGLIDFLLTQPKSVKELDYQLTQQDATALEALRRRLLWKWGIDDQPSDSGFVDLSNTH